MFRKGIRRMTFGKQVPDFTTRYFQIMRMKWLIGTKNVAIRRCLSAKKN